MASISKASQSVFRALESIFGTSSQADVNDRRFSRCSTLVETEDKHRSNGWSRTLRSVASFFYVEDIIQNQSHRQEPHTPPKDQSKARSRSHSWTNPSRLGSSTRLSSRKKTCKSDSLPISPSPKGAHPVPSLNVRIPNDSLLGHGANDEDWIDQVGIRALDPAELDASDCSLTDDDGIEFQLKALKPSSRAQKKVKTGTPGYASHVVPVENPFLDYPINTSVLCHDSGVIDHRIEYAAEISNHPSEQSIEMQNNVARKENLNDSGQTQVNHTSRERRPSADSPFVSESRLQTGHIQFEDSKPAPRTPEKTSPVHPASGRFHLRSRLSLKKSLERIHTKISHKTSPSRQNPRAATSRASSRNYDADGEDSENSPMTAGMGAREDFMRARSDRAIRHNKIVMDSRSPTQIDDETNSDLDLERFEVTSNEHNCMTQNYQYPDYPGVFPSHLRLAGEAVDRVSGRTMRATSQASTEITIANSLGDITLTDLPAARLAIDLANPSRQHLWRPIGGSESLELGDGVEGRGRSAVRRSSTPNTFRTNASLEDFVVRSGLRDTRSLSPVAVNQNDSQARLESEKVDNQPRNETSVQLPSCVTKREDPDVDAWTKHKDAIREAQGFIFKIAREIGNVECKTVTCNEAAVRTINGTQTEAGRDTWSPQHPADQENSRVDTCGNGSSAMKVAPARSSSPGTPNSTRAMEGVFEDHEGQNSSDDESQITIPGWFELGSS